MLPEYFAIIGAIIASAGGFYYLYETIRGTTKPNRVTWLLWGLLPMITFVAQRFQGVEGLSWVSFAAGFTPLLVVAASFLNKKAYWKTQPLDYALMGAATMGIILWAITKEPNLAILFALLADLLASIPTIIKSLKHPETESWIAYAISTVGFGIALLAIHVFNFENSAFVIYLFSIQIILTALTIRAPLKKRLKTN
ncbi:MAG TPA: hypothetical protein VIM31_02555 [Candidatus Microsaccharimonas sp.]|jgi:hypothetical protein